MDTPRILLPVVEVSIPSGKTIRLFGVSESYAEAFEKKANGLARSPFKPARKRFGREPVKEFFCRSCGLILEFAGICPDCGTHLKEVGP